jgi:hypothetical protein
MRNDWVATDGELRMQNELILLTVLDSAFDAVSSLLKYVVPIWCGSRL